MPLAESILLGPKPRLCKLTKWPTTAHRYPYGFFLREDPLEVRTGVYCHSIRRYPPSAAYLAGLRTHDKVIEVNFVYVESLSFKEIDRLIRQFSDHVTLLVACPVTVRFYENLHYPISHHMENLLCYKSPEFEPSPTTPSQLGAPQWRPIPCLRELILQDAPDIIENDQRLKPFDTAQIYVQNSLDAIKVFLEPDDTGENNNTLESLEDDETTLYFSFENSNSGDDSSQTKTLDWTLSPKSPKDNRRYVIMDLIEGNLKMKKNRMGSCAII